MIDDTSDDEPTSENALPDSSDDLNDFRSQRDRAAHELLDNAAAVKGPAFANYASSIFELAQLRLIFSVILAGNLSDEKKAAMKAQSDLLTQSIDSKISTELSAVDRIEAGKLAAQLIELTKKAGG